ncbi:low molecular weight phosphatase family protein [Cryobacterium arcticum]|uniref:Low molecular weight phosphatase family protein n=1 Tax=Cryobacterium arcticum TaxID=670052 RepID=A0A317ZS18_9MICO|nr:low molecular weight phosphatase family protein [Cryobacterium arcticum]
MLVVCTGNICRSPMAEQLLRARLVELGIPAEVSSAGSRAMVGDAMTPEAAAVSRRHGGGDGAHVAQQLTEQLVSSADLVLTASREHRSAVVGLHPRAARYSYTLNQFARLLEPLDNEADGADGSLTGNDAQAASPMRLRALVTEVAATRGFSPPPAHPADDDIEDPYRRPAEVYDRVGDLVDNAVTTIADAFAAAIRRN